MAGPEREAEQACRCHRSVAGDAGYVLDLKGRNVCDKKLITKSLILDLCGKVRLAQRRKHPVIEGFGGGLDRDSTHKDKV